MTGLEAVRHGRRAGCDKCRSWRHAVCEMTSPSAALALFDRAVTGGPSATCGGRCANGFPRGYGCNGVTTRRAAVVRGTQRAQATHETRRQPPRDIATSGSARCQIPCGGRGHARSTPKASNYQCRASTARSDARRRVLASASARDAPRDRRCSGTAAARAPCARISRAGCFEPTTAQHEPSDIKICSIGRYRLFRWHANP